MRVRVLNARTSATVIAIGVLFAVAGQGQAQAAARNLPTDEALSVLAMLAKQTLENYSKLATFDAEYAIEDVSIMQEDKLKTLRYKVPDVPGPWRERDTGIVRLKLDAVKDSLFTEIQMRECVLDQDANGKPMNHPIPLTEAQRAIVSPAHFYYFQYNAQYGDFREVPALTGKVGRAAMRKPLEEAQRQGHATVVDPRDFFGYAGFFWKQLEAIQDTLRKDTEGKVKRPAGATGPVITVESFGDGAGQEYRVALTLWRSLEGSGAGKIRILFRFAKRVGYNCESVGVSGETGADVEMTGWEYTTVKDIFIPSKISRVVLDPKKGQPKSRRGLVLKSCKVNEGIGDAELSLAALGLKDGERVLDYVDEVCYEYKDGGLVNPVSFDAPPLDSQARPASTSRPWLSVTLLVNVVFLLLLTGIFVWMRYRRRRSPA